MTIFNVIIDDYIKKHRNGAQNELRYFRIQRSLDDAIRLAALAEKPGGKRFDHQRRIPKKVLDHCYLILKKNTTKISKAHSFEELHSIISDLIEGVKGIGKLMVYDTALRIGAFLNLNPENIYLHAGTKVGAKKLGLDCSQKCISPKVLPLELRKLKLCEIEDVLCIYKTVLKSKGTISMSRNTNCGISRIVPKGRICCKI
jgi:hypothetical protein